MKLKDDKAFNDLQRPSLPCWICHRQILPDDEIAEDYVMYAHKKCHESLIKGEDCISCGL